MQFLLTQFFLSIFVFILSLLSLLFSILFSLLDIDDISFLSFKLALFPKADFLIPNNDKTLFNDSENLLIIFLMSLDEI